MSENERVFTESEVNRLVRYEDQVLVALYRNARKDQELDIYEKHFVRLFRKSVKLMIFPELVLEELPPEEPKPRSPLSPDWREHYYWLLGNRSRRVLALSDDELIDEFRGLIRSVPVELEL
jgi:hypothetical protein